MHTTEHGHCKNCGACLLFKAQIHRCPVFTMDADILEVFIADTEAKAPHSQRMRAHMDLHSAIGESGKTADSPDIEGK